MKNTNIKTFSITGWIHEIIKGTGGFLVCEDREVMIHPRGREASVAEWVLRCLANPACEDSDKVIDEIVKHRQKLKDGKIRL